ncbi:MAG: hypothetical protein M3297_12755 [Thermoproteota archaeon]|nr:hypothetical protein [Thermoproteota archaeon]
MSAVAAIDAIVRIVCKRFHGFSNPALVGTINTWRYHSGTWGRASWRRENRDHH